jgi:hypothetical protein
MPVSAHVQSGKVEIQNIAQVPDICQQIGNAIF